MATANSTRAFERISVQPAPDGRLEIELIGARAAVMAAILALEGSGIFDRVAASLRRHVLAPLHKAQTLAAREGRSDEQDQIPPSAIQA